MAANRREDGQVPQSNLQEERRHHRRHRRRVHTGGGRRRRDAPPLRLPQRHLHHLQAIPARRRDGPGSRLRPGRRRNRARLATHLHRQSALGLRTRRLIRRWLEPKSAITAPERNPAPEQRQSQLVFFIVARLAGGTRGFAWVFRIYDLDHRHHPVVLVVEYVAVEHELTCEVGEAHTHLYRTVG